MQYQLRDYRHFSSHVKRMLLTEILFGFASGLLSVHMNFYYTTTGLTTVDIGSIGIASAITTAVIAIAGGMLSSRLGYSPVYLLGTLMQGTGLLVCAATGNFVLILLGQVIYAAGLTFVHAVEFPYITYLTEEPYKAAAYFYLVFTYSASAIFGNLLGEQVLRLSGGLPNPYRLSLFISAAGFLLLTLLRVTMPNAHPPRKADSRGVFRQALALRPVRRYLLHHALYSFGNSLVASMLNLIYRTAFGFSDALIGQIFSIASLITALALVLLPLLLRRIAAFRISDALYLALMACMVVSILAPAPLFVVAMLLRSALLQLFPVVIESQMLNSLPPAHHGAYASLRILAVNIGSGAGSFITGLLLAYTNYHWLLAMGTLCAAGLFFLYSRYCKKYFTAARAEA